MVCSLHSVTTGSRDRANVPLIIIIIIIFKVPGLFVLWYCVVRRCFLSPRTLVHPEVLKPSARIPSLSVFR